MDAILFCADPSQASMDDAIHHLQTHTRLYFEVKFRIRRENFSFPIAGFIHISGDKVRCVAQIEDIVPFSADHFEYREGAEAIKPVQWVRQSTENGADV